MSMKPLKSEHISLQDLWNAFVKSTTNDITPNTFWTYVWLCTDDYTYEEVMHFCDEQDYIEEKRGKQMSKLFGRGHSWEVREVENELHLTLKCEFGTIELRSYKGETFDSLKRIATQYIELKAHGPLTHAGCCLQCDRITMYLTPAGLCQGCVMEAMINNE